MSLFGYNISTTPNLEKITRTWSKYTNANSPSTCSTYVYPSLITGRFAYIQRPFSHYGDRIHSSEKWVDLFQVLDNIGYETWWSGYLSPGFYHTGAGLDNTFSMTLLTPLLKAWFQGKGVRKTHFPYIPTSFQLMNHLAYTHQYGDQLDAAMTLFKQNTFDNPFFLYLHYSGVHGVPYPSGPFLGSILPIEEGLLDKESQNIVYGEYRLYNQPIADKLRLRYDESIRFQDTRLKDLINILKESDLYNSSMIIITADHGQVFENGFTSHNTPLVSYAETHVPLLIKYPYQKIGETIQLTVSTIDITPTILDILGIEYKEDWFDGMSLWDIDENQKSERCVFSRNPNVENFYITAICDQYKITLRSDQYFLFDYRKDPSENKNLIPILGVDNEIVQRLIKELDQFQERIKQYQ
jgi:arylsulfatase A-like enzyme